MSVFGEVMRDMRSTLGLSQARLADRLGTTQRHVSFVETGRSAPTAYFVTRLCRELDLSLAQRANLFETAGLPQAYPKRAPGSEDISALLDLIDARILSHWPFPAIVLDRDWTIIRANARFTALFAAFLPTGNAAANLLDILLSPQFRALIANWDEASEMFYYRLQVESAHNPQVRSVFDRAKATGVFDALPQTLANAGQTPMLVPVRLTLPGSPPLAISSMVGRLMGIQDALAEGFEIELFVPCDQDTETAMLKAAPTPE